MKIDYAIMGSNENPTYIDFWHLISKTWKEIFNITPVLGLICDEDSDFYEDEYGLVKKFKRIEGIDSGLQSQIIRLYLPKLLNGNIIITDIDMVPLSKLYFIDQVDFFDENKIHIMSSDNAECNRNKEIPMCYNISNTKLISEILELDLSWVKFANKLNSMNEGWSTDQRYLWDMIQKYRITNNDKVVTYNRGWPNGATNRIDRLWWSYNPELVKKGLYIDSHLLRPYKENKEEVDKLINLLW
jgi:hypothetical protein